MDKISKILFLHNIPHKIKLIVAYFIYLGVQKNIYSVKIMIILPLKTK